MKRDVHEPLPNVERIVEFSEEDFRENPMITSAAESSISDEEWDEFEDNALVITDGDTVCQYAEEFPIVVYRCSEGYGLVPRSEPNLIITAAPVQGRLNAFIESITVATANCGKRFSLNKREMESEFTGFEIVAYYIDNIGRYIMIPCYDIVRLLVKKPNLVISNEGLLVFFTDKHILVTCDCEHYAWVHGIDTENSKITSIDVFDEYCIVNVKDDESDKYSHYKLQFIVNMGNYGMINPIVTKRQENNSWTEKGESFIRVPF